MRASERRHVDRESARYIRGTVPIKEIVPIKDSRIYAVSYPVVLKTGKVINYMCYNENFIGGSKLYILKPKEYRK